jgi:hypothetical protein
MLDAAECSGAPLVITLLSESGYFSFPPFTQKLRRFFIVRICGICVISRQSGVGGWIEDRGSGGRAALDVGQGTPTQRRIDFH